VTGALLIVVCVLSLPPFLGAHERDGDGAGGSLTHVLWEVPTRVVTGVESETAYLQRRIPAYSALQHLNDLADAGDTVVIATDPYVDFHAEPRAVPDYAVCLRRAGLGRGGVDDYRALRRAGVDYVLVEDRLRADSVVPWHDPDFARHYLEQVYADEKARLFRVRPNPAG
jgi:hypothetical protein